MFRSSTTVRFAVEFRDKSNYVVLSGLAKIRWAAVRASGLHVVHLVIKLADGTWLLSEHSYGSNQLQVRPVEFTVSAPEKRWMKLDIDRVVTLGPREPGPDDGAKADKVDSDILVHTDCADERR